MLEAKVAVAQEDNPAWRDTRIGTLRWIPDSKQLEFEDGAKPGFTLSAREIRRITHADENVVLHTSHGVYHLAFPDIADAVSVATAIEAALS
jgi:hypothetical protein